MFAYFYSLQILLEDEIRKERDPSTSIKHAFEGPNYKLITDLYDLIEALENEENQ